MRNIEQLVSSQVSFYEMRHKLETAKPIEGRGKVDGVTFGPYLTISRELGSGGRELARLVGEKLGWQVFDREVVDAIAERTQVRRQLIESLDERERPWAQQFMASALDRHDIGSTGYGMELRQVVLALGQQGSVIIVGRGANFILPQQFGVAVRLIAPLEARATRLSEEHKTSLEKARQELSNSDRDRTAFVRGLFKREVHDPLCYDLVLNTGALSPEQAAHITLAALESKLNVKSDGDKT